MASAIAAIASAVAFASTITNCLLSCQFNLVVIINLIIIVVNDAIPTWPRSAKMHCQE
jgi:hypothetical protein